MKFTVKSNIFIDSNIWIYAFLDSEKEHDKQRKALTLLEEIPADSMVSRWLMNSTGFYPENTALTKAPSRPK